METITQNNHDSMKTVVETFVIEETAELIYDNEQLDKWNKHVEELGLIGQTKIVKKDKSPIPFMHMKKSIENVFSTLCPIKVSVENYDVTPIPIQILDVIALSKRENYFEQIQVWYDDKNPDPAVIGINHRAYYAQDNNGSLKESFGSKQEAMSKMIAMEWTKYKPYGVDPTYYLLGKWADVRRSFDELKEIATKRFIAEQGNELRKKIKEAQRQLDDLTTEAFGRFGSESTDALPF